MLGDSRTEAMWPTSVYKREELERLRRRERVACVHALEGLRDRRLADVDPRRLDEVSVCLPLVAERRSREPGAEPRQPGAWFSRDRLLKARLRLRESTGPECNQPSEAPW